MVHLRIEEDNRKRDKNVTQGSMESNAYLIEGESSKVKTKSHSKCNKRKSTYHGSKDHDPKKIKGNCWVCEIPRHRASDCQHKKGF